VKALLDTDTVSELMRAKNATVLARAEAYKAEPVFEILQGLHRLHRTEQATDFAAWLADCEVLELDRPTAVLAGEISGALIRAGRVIGVVDTCIAATALRHDRVLVTGNERHYDFVRAAGFPLQVDNWRNPAP
jgi:predicted nucleic acid-binding protein